jgi:hypothetical protein
LGEGKGGSVGGAPYSTPALQCGWGVVGAAINSFFWNLRVELETLSVGAIMSAPTPPPLTPATSIATVLNVRPFPSTPDPPAHTPCLTRHFIASDTCLHPPLASTSSPHLEPLYACLASRSRRGGRPLLSSPIHTPGTSFHASALYPRTPPTAKLKRKHRAGPETRGKDDEGETKSSLPVITPAADAGGRLSPFQVFCATTSAEDCSNLLGTWEYIKSKLALLTRRAHHVDPAHTTSS